MSTSTSNLITSSWSQLYKPGAQMQEGTTTLDSNGNTIETTPILLSSNTKPPPVSLSEVLNTHQSRPINYKVLVNGLVVVLVGVAMGLGYNYICWN